MKWLRNSRGFTLIEMVLIIVILGVLAAVAIPQFINLQEDAQAANNMAYIGALRSALGMRLAEQLVREGNTATVATEDVIGNDTATAGATAAFLQGRVQNPTTPPATLTSAGTDCGAGTPGSWTSTVDIQGFTTPTFTLTCGATASDPVSIVCTAPGGCTL